MYARMSILKIKVLKTFSSERGILSPWGVQTNGTASNVNLKSDFLKYFLKV